MRKSAKTPHKHCLVNRSAAASRAAVTLVRGEFLTGKRKCVNPNADPLFRKYEYEAGYDKPIPIRQNVPPDARFGGPLRESMEENFDTMINTLMQIVTISYTWNVAGAVDSSGKFQLDSRKGGHPDPDRYYLLIVMTALRLMWGTEEYEHTEAH